MARALGDIESDARVAFTYTQPRYSCVGIYRVIILCRIANELNYVHACLLSSRARRRRTVYTTEYIPQTVHVHVSYAYLIICSIVVGRNWRVRFFFFFSPIFKILPPGRAGSCTVTTAVKVSTEKRFLSVFGSRATATGHHDRRARRETDSVTAPPYDRRPSRDSRDYKRMIFLIDRYWFTMRATNTSAVAIRIGIETKRVGNGQANRPKRLRRDIEEDDFVESECRNSQRSIHYIIV